MLFVTACWSNSSIYVPIQCGNYRQKSLVNDRATVIKGALKPKGNKLTAKAARRLAEQILRPDARQRLPAYCVAIAQAALQHAEREERRATRMKKRH